LLQWSRSESFAIAITQWHRSQNRISNRNITIWPMLQHVALFLLLSLSLSLGTCFSPLGLSRSSIYFPFPDPVEFVNSNYDMVIRTSRGSGSGTGTSFSSLRSQVQDMLATPRWNTRASSLRILLVARRTWRRRIILSRSG
jgi:hypothetical protein